MARYTSIQLSRLADRLQDDGELAIQEIINLVGDCQHLTVDLINMTEKRDTLAAEVDQWRRAVRYETVNTENHYHLKVGGVIVGVVVFVDRWSAMTMGTHYLELGSRDAACAKLCEVLGIPVLVPTAPARQ